MAELDVSMDYCSQLALGDDPSGTAEQVDCWLLIEYSGPWRAKALTDNELPPEVAGFLQAAQRAAATAHRRLRPQFVRRPGSSTDAPWLMVAHCHEIEAGVLRGRRMLSYAELAAQDPTELLSEQWGESLPPTTLVCTNGARDACCSKFGRPVYDALLAADKSAWETTHVGGHRYAANLVCLPSGIGYGFTTPESAPGIVHDLAAGQLHVELLRGRSGQDKALQVAEIAVRRATGNSKTDAVTQLTLEPIAAGGDGEGRIVAVTVAGQVHRCRVWQDPPERVLASCGEAGVKMARPWRSAMLA